MYNSFTWSPPVRIHNIDISWFFTSSFRIAHNTSVPTRMFIRIGLNDAIFYIKHILYILNHKCKKVFLTFSMKIIKGSNLTAASRIKPLVLCPRWRLWYLNLGITEIIYCIELIGLITIPPYQSDKNSEYPMDMTTWSVDLWSRWH